MAREFAKALKEEVRSFTGYMESENVVVTWCVGHLVTMSYPDAYDPQLKSWSLSTLPFLPQEFRYEVIPSASKQFEIVSGLLVREDVDTIYICTDSGREGEYIYRLVDQMACVDKNKVRKRVWIDSQTEEEILRGIREAKDWSAYDNLSAAAYLRAKEDYLMGINFSRVLTLKYGSTVAACMGSRRVVISVGRVMTCVLGMVVRREREIRDFVKTPFYRVKMTVDLSGMSVEGEWKVTPGSRFDTGKFPPKEKGKNSEAIDYSLYLHPKLWRENGFRRKEDAQSFVRQLQDIRPQEALVKRVERKQERKNPPLLYNLAELQNDCSKLFKISPDETLKVVQELYEKKLVTYPRTDARVLSSAVAKEIDRNLKGLTAFEPARQFAAEILESGSFSSIGKSRYTNDSLITDHYAIIPTGQGMGALRSLQPLSMKVYEGIVRRFLAIFYGPAVYRRVNLVLGLENEEFFATFKALEDPGYRKVTEYRFAGSGSTASGLPGSQQENGPAQETLTGQAGENSNPSGEPDMGSESARFAALTTLKKGMRLPVLGFAIREGETSPPKRYNSGTMILAMENAGQLIEDEQLREQIRGSGIGTSATRAEILKKLVKNGYLDLNKKTQMITPTLLGEIIYDVVYSSIRSLLNPELTASWEKGLNFVANGEITSEEYMEKLNRFVGSHTEGVKRLQNQNLVRSAYERTSRFYKKKSLMGK